MRYPIRLLALALILAGGLVGTLRADDGALDQSMLDQFNKEMPDSANTNRIINAVANNDIKHLSLNRAKMINQDKLFNFKLKTAGIVNQRGSGRCWMFAGNNVFAPRMMTKLQMSEFELSEPYLTFYDKMEKANFFLERMIELRDKPLDDRSVQGEIDNAFGDGGWWTYFQDLVQKYGVVPLSVMPETHQSTSTGNINRLATTILRGGAADIRQMAKEGKSVKDLRKYKKEVLGKVYKLLVYNYGVPPAKFTFRYEAKKDTVKSITEGSYTPQSFFHEFFGESIPDYVGLVNVPTLPYDTLYILEQSRNIYEKPDQVVLNLPMDKLVKYAKTSLLDSQAVWFACDVGQQNYGDSAIMEDQIYDYNTTFGMNFILSKANRINFHEISPNHAMVLTGVDTTDAGAPDKWLVENSWGTKRGDKGFWYMYPDWFNQYVLMIVVDKNLLSQEDQQKFKQKPHKIADWEPFFRALRNLN
jgi:bleomycin hydrolase